jgi:hypothetical protein
MIHNTIHAYRSLHHVVADEVLMYAPVAIAERKRMTQKMLLSGPVVWPSVVAGEMREPTMRWTRWHVRYEVANG